MVRDEDSPYERRGLEAVSQIADLMEEWESQGRPTSGPEWEAAVAQIQDDLDL